MLFVHRAEWLYERTSVYWEKEFLDNKSIWFKGRRYHYAMKLPLLRRLK